MDPRNFANAPYRPVATAPRAVEVERAADGTIVLRSPLKPREPPRSVCELLARWALQAPERTFLAQRNHVGEWEQLSYEAAWTKTRAIGESLLAQGIGAGAKIAILSGNSIEHALLMFAAMAVGAAAVPISPNYSLLPGGVARLAEIVAVAKPDLVFVQQFPPFAHVRDVAGFATAPWISVEPHPQTGAFDALLQSAGGSRFDAAFAAVDGATTAKILFTSGSTGSPKGVINTHRMLCNLLTMTDAAMMASSMPQPQVQVEWMPWHHTMGGNAILLGVLNIGGTLYIDQGKPTPELFHRTLAALREISPTSMLTVPAGYELLVDALERDEALRASFFSRISRLGYGGAALPQAVIDRMQRLAVATVGKRIAFTSGYGATETASTVAVTHWPSEESGEIGLPVPGLELKLVPIGDRYEMRVRGPNVMPGYLGRADLSAAAFDAAGFYGLGDAATFVDPARPELGLKFAGRVAENFKLATGVWVIVGNLRLTLLDVAQGLLSDIVIVGENRNRIAILAWPNARRAAAHLIDEAAVVSVASCAKDAGLIDKLRQLFRAHNSLATSSSRVSAFRLLAEPPSLAAGEITDKGYVNQRAVLAHRATLVEELYSDPAPGDVITL